MIKFFYDNPKKYAFTLIELIVVIIIIGILASVAIPSYNSYIQNAKSQANANLKKYLERIIDNHLLNGGSPISSHGPLGWNAEFYVNQQIGYVEHSDLHGIESYEFVGTKKYHSSEYYFPLMALVMVNSPTIQINAFCTGKMSPSYYDMTPWAGKTWQELHTATGNVFNPIYPEYSMGIKIVTESGFIAASGNPGFKEINDYQIILPESPNC